MSQTPNSKQAASLDSSKFSKKKRSRNSSIKPPRGRSKTQNKSQRSQLNLPTELSNDVMPTSTINEENLMRIQESQGNFTTVFQEIIPAPISEEDHPPSEPSDEENDESNQEEDPVELALKNLKSDDPDYILNTLLDLSTGLSLAHESVAENSKCKDLLRELLSIIDKFNMPELSSNNYYIKLIISGNP
jgi:hypothetical protein